MTRKSPIKKLQQPPQNSILNPSLPRMPSLPSLASRSSTSSTSTIQPPPSSNKESNRNNESNSKLTQQNHKASCSSLALSISTDDGTDHDNSFSADEFAEERPIRRVQDFRAESRNQYSERSESRASLLDKGKGKENVVVCLRVRPTDKVLASPIYSLDTDLDKLTLTPFHPTLLKRGSMKKSSGSKEDEYTFDALHIDPMVTADLYFKKIQPVVQAAMEGFNGTVFAYGQTASGKTHTMMGTVEEAGIIPLAIEELFAFISEQGDARSYALRVQFLEIYNEQLRDLLSDAPLRAGSRPLDVTGDEGKVAGLTAKSVNSSKAVMDYLEEGDRRRRVGATDWNERSSRSHCVFTVTIESSGLDERGLQVDRSSRLNLIDLAGSESATSSGDRQKEGSFINKSLLALGTVISKLTESGANSSTHIPYRDSKLTRLLQPALSGRSRVAIICTVSPDAEQATETVSTLKFAKRAKMIETKAERSVAVSTDQMMLHRATQDMNALNQQIEALEAAARDREDAIALGAAQKAISDAEIERQNLEIQSLKDQHDSVSSKIITKVTVDASNRRASGGLGFGLGTPGRRNGGIGMGSPRTGLRIFSENMGASPRIGSMEKETELEAKIEALQARLDAQTSQATESYQQLEASTSARVAQLDLEKNQTLSSLAEKAQLLLDMEGKWKTSSHDLVEARKEKKSTHKLWKDGLGELESSSKELESLKLRYREIEVEHQKLLEQESRLGASEVDRNLELSRELEDARLNSTELSAAIESLNGVSLTKTSEISNLEMKIEKLLKDHSEEINELKNKLKSAEDSLTPLTTQLNSVSIELKQKYDNEFQLEQAQKLINSLQGFLDDKTAEITKKTESNESLLSLNAKLQKSLDSYQSANTGRRDGKQSIHNRVAAMTGKQRISVDPNSVEGLELQLSTMRSEKMVADTELLRLHEIIVQHGFDIESKVTRDSFRDSYIDKENAPHSTNGLPITRSRTTSRGKHESLPILPSDPSRNSSSSQYFQPLPQSPMAKEPLNRTERRKTFEKDLVNLTKDKTVTKILASPYGTPVKAATKSLEVEDSPPLVARRTTRSRG